MKRRLLSILLALCMILTLAPSPFALAADATCSDGCFSVNGIVYQPISGKSNEVQVVNPAQHPVNGPVESTYTGAITIPRTVSNNDINYTVTKIGNMAFWGSSQSACSVTSVSLPDSITEIGDSAFVYCTSLTSLNIPNNVTKIGSGAFGKCEALTSLSIPAGVTSGLGNALLGGAISRTGTTVVSSNRYPYAASVTIASGSPYEIIDGVLYNGTTLECVLDFTKTTISVREGTTEIADYAGANLGNITSVTLPSTVKTIGDNAFRGVGVSSVDLTNVTEIGKAAFQNCDSLVTVTWPNSLETMGKQAFENCTALTDVDLKGPITEIPEMAFNGCVSIKTISLPSGLTTIGEMAFCLLDEDTGENASPALEYMNIPSSVTSIGAAFLAGVKENGETVLVFEGETLPIFVEAEDEWSLGALDCIAGEYMNSPTIYYPASAVEAYTAAGSALVTAGLVTAPSSEDENQKEQGYALPASASVSVVAGETVEIGGYTLPDGADLTVTSSNTSTATVADDTANKKLTVTGVAAGNVTVTAAIKKGAITLAEETYTVTVAAAVVPVTGVTLDKATLRLTVGDTGTLAAAVAPANATNQGVTWSSDNESVATVDSNGTVAAVGGGTATITVTTADGGKTATCVVTVQAPYVPTPPVTPVQPVNPTPTPDPDPDPDPTPGVWSNPYADVSAGDWYYDAVTYVSAKGLMTGTTASTFAPNDTMTRAMVWMVLARMEGQSVEGGSPWYALAQSWAMNAAVSDGTGPNDSITREQLITMLYRQAGSPEVGVPELAKLGQFSDGEAVSDWAQSAMAWAVSTGILTGEAGALNPQAGATRAQVAAILMRFCQQ